MAKICFLGPGIGCEEGAGLLCSSLAGRSDSYILYIGTWSCCVVPFWTIACSSTFFFCFHRALINDNLYSLIPGHSCALIFMRRFSFRTHQPEATCCSVDCCGAYTSTDHKWSDQARDSPLLAAPGAAIFPTVLRRPNVRASGSLSCLNGRKGGEVDDGQPRPKPHAATKRARPKPQPTAAG